FGFTSKGRYCGVSEIRRDERTLDVASASAHPVEHVCGRADDDVREFDRGALERLELERGRPTAKLPVRFVRPTRRTVAVDRKCRVGERKAELARAERCISRRVTVVRNDELGRIVAE